jgi:hypothetical protein
MLIEFSELTVDPSVTQRGFDGLRLGNGCFRRAGFRELEPKAALASFVCRQIGFDRWQVRKQYDWTLYIGHASTSHGRLSDPYGYGRFVVV